MVLGHYLTYAHTHTLNSTLVRATARRHDDARARARWLRSLLCLHRHYIVHIYITKNN